MWHSQLVLSGINNVSDKFDLFLAPLSRLLCCALPCPALQLMFLMLFVGVVFNVVKGAIGGSSKSKNQDW
jgi:hypothetical protein